MKMGEYTKIYIARGWDSYQNKSFNIIGKVVNSEALVDFTEKQINGFGIKIMFSKNFFGDDCEQKVKDFIMNEVHPLYLNVGESCNLFKGRENRWSIYMDDENLKDILSVLYGNLTIEEIMFKRNKAKQIALDKEVVEV